jgi:nicotinamidase-related amidase
MNNNFKCHPLILDKNKTALLIIDIQEKILAVMQNPDSVVANTLKLIKGFKILGSPIYITEQYPKGLGSTQKDISNELENITALQKMSFSGIGAEDLFLKLKGKDIKQVVVAGIEAHVCVQQTVLDLLENNFQVNLAVDAVSSRHKIDYETAIDRMRTRSAEITTTESILFEMLRLSGTDEFKQISKVIK